MRLTCVAYLMIFLVRDFLVIVKKRIAVTSDGGSGEGSELGRVVCGVSRQPAG